MHKLTGRQLVRASYLAHDIRKLEAAKDRCHAFTVPFDIGGFGRDSIEVKVPMAPILKELNDRISAAHAQLAAMGIELLPPTPEELREADHE